MERIRSRIRKGYRPPTATRSSRILLVAAVANAILPQFAGWIPDSTVLVYTLVVIYSTYLLLFLSTPVWFHLDRKVVIEQTDYNPSPLFYIAVFFPPLSFGSVLLYLYYRGKAFEEAEATESSVVEE